MPDGDSFLPRIQSVFYAVFDVRQGPKIVFQVPEALIAVSSQGPPGSASFSPAPAQNASTDSLNSLSSTSRASPSPSVSISLTSHLHSPNKRSVSSLTNANNNQNTSKYLFHFDDISKFVIPPSALCGRKVICATRDHRIIGFPVELQGHYERNYFRYNLCFVFQRQADLSCYEPIVRKVARVFEACEEESSLLSHPPSPTTIPSILEQLYEDLNSYSETSIPIDRFNTLELKIFPFYPNPPPVKDWHVPLALIKISTWVEANWDLTMVKVIKYIDGVNHVSRIAHLADCDLDLTRLAISHLLYYQVIMTIDIFQYTNMYTLRKSIQWLADETHVREECGLYVTKLGKPIPDFPHLLHLYSRLKPGQCVYDWAQKYDVLALGIDVRRFVSFGVIKGFLRRVHRYPILIKPMPQPNLRHSRHPSATSLSRKRGKAALTALSYQTQTQAIESRIDDRDRGKVPKAPPTLASINTELAVSARGSPVSSRAGGAWVGGGVKSPIDILQKQEREREAAKERSEAERSLERLRSQSHVRGGGGGGTREKDKEWKATSRRGSAFWNATLALSDASGAGLGSGQTAPRGLFTVGDGDGILNPNLEMRESGLYGPATISAVTRANQSPSIPPVLTPVLTTSGLTRSPSIPSVQTPTMPTSSGSSPTNPLPQSLSRNSSLTQSQRRPRVPSMSNTSRLSGASLSQSQSQTSLPPYPQELLGLLDGEHHTDELGTRFEVGCPMLEVWLGAIPEGEGKIEVIYR